MSREKGKKFWQNLINEFAGKTLTDDDFARCDLLDVQLTDPKDKTVQVYWDIMIENDEQKENYFVRNMNAVVDKVYDENHLEADF